MAGGHSDWVRDVAWAPSLGLPFHTIASAGQVRAQPPSCARARAGRVVHNITVLDADATIASAGHVRTMLCDSWYRWLRAIPLPHCTHHHLGPHRRFCICMSHPMTRAGRKGDRVEREAGRQRLGGAAGA